jgi:hypothetical protein
VHALAVGGAAARLIRGDDAIPVPRPLPLDATALLSPFGFDFGGKVQGSEFCAQGSELRI